MGGWVDGWLNGWGHVKITKYQINLDLIEIVQFCLKIYDLWRQPHLWFGVYVVGWVNCWVNGWGQVKSLKIK